MRNWLWMWAFIFNVTGMLNAACGGPDKPVVPANPEFANCEARKDQVEDECLIEAGTRAQFDDCIARVRKSCVDGGTK